LSEGGFHTEKKEEAFSKDDPTPKKATTAKKPSSSDHVAKGKAERGQKSGKMENLKEMEKKLKQIIDICEDN
jgi:hypothetical protein